MRILYVAKHGSGDNDDEGAIAHALIQMGHEVLRVPESAHKFPAADFCLFHKMPNVDRLAQVRCPKAFWYFDLVDGRFDPTLAARSVHRISWMRNALNVSDFGFCTDGDWVSCDGTGKLRWLMQGADERTLQEPKDLPLVHDVLFTGMVNHGQKRAQHIAELKERYSVTVIGDAGPRRRVHGKQLADLFASSKAVVAPDGPSSDRYWSNRVYLTLGLGGFLLHPSCSGLAEHFNVRELKTYGDRRALEMLLDYYLDRPDDRTAMRINGHEAVKRKHLYRHRCEQLLEVACKNQ